MAEPILPFWERHSHMTESHANLAWNSADVHSLQRNRKHRRPKWRVQDCCGCWVFPFPFSCSCGRSVGCIRLGPNRLVPTRQRMNGIFYLVGLIVVALLVIYALGLW